jgi:2-polyprenyl-3-methyl-5-hydroxy-6-metoxy-1,4-benzoquinol methylase
MNTPDLEAQRLFWNEWDTRHREHETTLDRASTRRRDEVLRHLDRLGLEFPRILEVGCANGWLSRDLARFGRVVGTDLADECVRLASNRYPQIRFVAGDFLTLDFGERFDVLVCVDSIASMSDHEAVFTRFATLLRRGGHLILTTQNPRVMGRYSKLEPVAAGQVRNWANEKQLRRLLGPSFVVENLTTAHPALGDRGVMRLVHSYKVNKLLALLIGEKRVQRLKEWLGFGQTIVLHATRR